MENYMKVLSVATYITAESIARRMLKNTTVRSEMISAQELIDMQTGAVLDAINIVLLNDRDTDELWKAYFEKTDLIETLTY